MDVHIHCSEIDEKLIIQYLFLGYDPYRAWARVESQKWIAKMKAKARELLDHPN